VPGLDAPAVVSDDVSGGYLAAEHLVKQGHHRIAAVFPPPYSTARAREDGFRKALEDNGVEVRNEWIQYACTDDPEPEKTMVEALFSQAERPTAIFAFHDELAAAVFNHLKTRGLRVPEDVALVGYNDCVIAMTLPVPLTSVAYPKYEIGANAARLLLRGARTASETIVLPPRLVVRASSVKKPK
ncbi:MAG TPA: substrate-binding domain-containing protein, partial [bacterium]|nr:substrate-binding domain-containing protein [bacterium]